MVKYMYPDSMSITYIYVEEQRAICTWVDMLDIADSIGWVLPSSLSTPLPLPEDLCWKITSSYITSFWKLLFGLRERI